MVDVLVNSAGITKKVDHADLEGLTDAEFDRILTVNVRGTFSVIRAFTPLLRSSGDAVVATICPGARPTGADLQPLAGGGRHGFVAGRDPAVVRAQAASAPLRVVADPDDVACSLIGAVTSLRLSSGTVVVFDGGGHL